ncbi:MAG: ATP-binding cassette domain-containing protein [Acidimicrobiales bacterium]
MTPESEDITPNSEDITPNSSANGWDDAKAHEPARDEPAGDEPAGHDLAGHEPTGVIDDYVETKAEDHEVIEEASELALEDISERKRKKQDAKAAKEAKWAEEDRKYEAEKARRKAEKRRGRGKVGDEANREDLGDAEDASESDDLRRAGVGDLDYGVRRTGPARLSIKNLKVTFGGVHAVDGVSIDVEPGSLVGLVGPNGSGKTTLLDAISGLVRCSDGSVQLDEVDIVDHLPEERAHLGIVRSFQDCRLYPELTVEDTLLVSEDTRNRSDVISTTLRLPWARSAEAKKREAVDRVIASFGLERFRNHRTNQLSTGTRRVVDLASIVLSKPRLLLLDEPTAGIAQREAEAFVPLLQRLQQVTGATILLVEHDVPLVFELCSTVVVMETGKVVSSGTPEEVGQDPKALAAYLGASDEALLVSGPSHVAPVMAGEPTSSSSAQGEAPSASASASGPA